MWDEKSKADALGGLDLALKALQEAYEAIRAEEDAEFIFELLDSATEGIHFCEAATHWAH